MAINFYRFREELLTSWREVQDVKNKNTDWVVFGYASQTNDLEVVAKGYGLEDLSEELNSCKIQYAFCRVLDPNTELPKCVFINWCGEGAPLARKGICANHIADVANFFKGAHLTINARTEEDIEPAVIINRVIKASTTQINFKDRSDPVENVAPVGSTYQRVQPRLEINVTEREKFWTQQQDEEKKRKAADRKSLDEQRKKVEDQAKLREVRESKDREQAAIQKEADISRQREVERNAENTIRSQSRKNSAASAASSAAEDDEERAQRTEAARKARAEEAKSVISGGSIRNVRAMFEQNSSAGQLNTVKPAITVRKLSFPKQPVETPVEAEKAPEIEKPVAEKVVVPRQEPAAAAVTVKKQNQEPAKREEELLVSRQGTAVPIVASQPEPAVVTKEMAPVSNGSAKVPLTNGTSPSATVTNGPSTVTAAQPIVQSIPERVVVSSLSEPDAEEVTASPQPTEEDDAYANLEDEVADEVGGHGDGVVPGAQNGGYTAQVVYAEPLEDIYEEEEELESEAAKKANAANVLVATAAAQNQAQAANMGLRAKALYDYQAADDTEITFDPDDIISHIEQIDEGWWQGMGPDGTYGLFPANYVELLDG